MNQGSEHIIIVGGGVIGIACAHYLSKAGAKVTVIEKDVMGGACSQGNCGYICSSHILPLTEPDALWTGMKSLFNPKAAFRIKPQMRPALWRWLWEFTLRCNHKQMLVAGGALKAILESSLREYKQIVQTESLACEWEDKGLLYVFRTPGAMRHFGKADQFVAKHFGVSATRIEGESLPDFEPALKPGLAGAFHYPGDASVRPDLLNSQWVDHLRSKGVDFIEHCSLTNVRRAGGEIKALETTKGVLEADRFVFAVGAWSAKLAPVLGCRLPIEPGKGYSVTMARPTVCPTHPMLLPEEKVGVSPFKKGYRLGSMMEFSGFDSTIPSRRIEQLRHSAESYLIEPHTDTVFDTWYGWRPMTWDSLPIIGQVPNVENSYLATGHNMLGTAIASGTGMLLKELMLGESPHIDPAPYSPSRFS
jgi:D-amino-acid dehydrogenase